MGGRRALVLVASVRRYCSVCDGTGRVLIRAIPDGEFVEWDCLHCVSTSHLPVAYLPAYDDQPRSA